MKLTQASNKLLFNRYHYHQYLKSTTTLSIRFKSIINSQQKNKQNIDIQFLQQSILPTDFFQKSLPRLPIPKLEKTCERYLQSLQPIICNREQFENTTRIVKNFELSIGKELHDKLLKSNRINKHTSYISQPWFEMYLKSRLPLVLNYNPFMSWKGLLNLFLFN